MIPLPLGHILIPKQFMRFHRRPPQPLFPPPRPLNPLLHPLPLHQKPIRRTHTPRLDHLLKIPFRRLGTPSPEKRPTGLLPPARALCEPELAPKGRFRRVVD